MIKKAIRSEIIMKTGDFSNLGEHFRKYRAGYSEEVLRLLICYAGLSDKKNVHFVDVGAGTGIWTRQVLEKLHPSKCAAVEPNDDMRQNGKLWTKGFDVNWIKGTAEKTGLPGSSADWVTMASSFHWTEPNKSLPEFHRILKPNGYLTLLWNPLLKEGDSLQEKVESIIKRVVPEFSRGSRANDNFREVILSTGRFKDVIEIRKVNYVRRTTKDYIETWKAVNHLQAVAGPERFKKFISEVKELLKNKKHVDVPYLTKSWTAQRVD